MIVVGFNISCDVLNESHFLELILPVKKIVARFYDSD
jgi:hypothetical protein